MIYIAYSAVLLLTYILQTTLLSLPLRPELMLIVFCLFWSGKKHQALWGGLLTGFFLDFFNGYSFYNSLLYVLVSLLCGYMPVSIFRNYKTLVLVNLLISSVILNIGYAILSRIFSGKFIFVYFWYYPLVVILNLVFFYLLYWLFWRRKHGQ